MRHTSLRRWRRAALGALWLVRDLGAALCDQVWFRWRQRRRELPSYVSRDYLRERAGRHER